MHIAPYNRLLRDTAIAMLAAVSAVVTGCSGSDEGDQPVVIDGLTAPRGLASTLGGDLVIAETGAGRVLVLENGGTVSEIVTGMPHTLDSGPGSVYPSGPSAALYSNDELFVLVGEFKGDRFARLYRVTGIDEYEAVTGPNDAFSAATNRFANPYDFLSAPEVNGWLVSDSGRNALLAVDHDGKTRDYALFNDLAVPGVDRPVQVVPTGIARGPDGAVYVASLTGFPFLEGSASIWRVEDKNSDGDALDPEEIEQYLTGLTTVTDIAFDASGILHLSEFSSDMVSVIEGGSITENAPLYPGRIIRWDGTELKAVAEGLTSPTSITFVGEKLYVSEELAGRVREIPLR